MAFKTNNASSGGTYLSFDEQFINADNTAANGYDVTTLPSNETKITASDAAFNDRFGDSIGVGSRRIVVGASGGFSNSITGYAYIFDLDGNELAKITPSDGAAGDRFGNAAAIGLDRIVVCAVRDDDAGSSSGSAYIFDLDGNELTKITASDAASGDNFGQSVAVGSGRIVIGAYRDDDNGSDSGSAYVFDLDGMELTKITASDAASNDRFGFSVAVGSGRICVGAYRDDDNGSDSGSAYVFDLDGTELTKITASDAASNDRFGSTVAVGSGRIIVGASRDDDNGDTSGSAYIFDLNGNELTKITASDGSSFDGFGDSVAVGSGRIIVGAAGADTIPNLNRGAAYIFDLDGNELTKVLASDPSEDVFFGFPVVIHADKIVIGCRLDDDNGNDSGSAYIYDTPNIQHTLDILD